MCSYQLKSLKFQCIKKLDLYKDQSSRLPSPPIATDRIVNNANPDQTTPSEAA